MKICLCVFNVFTIETVAHSRAFGKYFKENYDKYQTFNEYFETKDFTSSAASSSFPINKNINFFLY